MKFKLNAPSLIYITAGLILAVPCFGIWRIFHPIPTKITQLHLLSGKLDLWFPPGTVLLDGGYVSQTSSIYPASNAYGVVNMPRSRIAQLYKQATVIPKSQQDIAWCRNSIIESPKQQNFYSKEWDAESVKNYQALYYAGEGGIIMIDMDNNSAVVKVYIAFG